MKRKNLLIATVAGLSLAMLTACSTSEVSNGSVNSETTTEATTIATEDETTEKETTAQKETEETTEEKETESQEETTAEKETEEQEETTTQQKPTEAPTQKPTEAPTQKPTEAPTQKPTEAPTQKPTEAPTQKPTEAPTQKPTEAPTEAPTEEPWNKTVYEEAAIQVFENSYASHIGFVDLNNDNVPELLTNTEFNCHCIYVYENDKYVVSDCRGDFRPWESKIYRDELGNILVFAVSATLPYSYNGIDVLADVDFSLINWTTGDGKSLGKIVTDNIYDCYQECTPIELRIYPEKSDSSSSGSEDGYYGGGGNYEEVNQAEFEQFMTDAVKGYTFVKNADEIYVAGYSEQSIKKAYKRYIESN